MRTSIPTISVVVWLATGCGTSPPGDESSLMNPGGVSGATGNNAAATDSTVASQATSGSQSQNVTAVMDLNPVTGSSSQVTNNSGNTSAMNAEMSGTSNTSMTESNAGGAASEDSSPDPLTADMGNTSSGSAAESTPTGGAGASSEQSGSATGEPAQGGTVSGGSVSSGNEAATVSVGCGVGTPLESGTFTIDVDGMAREYVLDVPAGYDTNHAYPLVFVWHPLGGSADQVVRGNYDGLKPLSDGTAILVAPDGLEGMAAGITGQGWYNEGGGDMAFLRAMLAHFNDNLCIDQQRLFSSGFSFGGMMSYAIGCEMADVFRAIAPASGNTTGSGCMQPNDHRIAMIGFHGDADDFVATDGGRMARDIFVARNHCQEQTEPTDPEPCVAYQGCDEGYPVTWCEFPGAHQPWSEAPEAIWNFFSQF